MAKKKKTKRRARPIVIGHLEKISSKVFDRYRKQITDMIKGKENNSLSTCDHRQDCGDFCRNPRGGAVSRESE